MERLRRWFAGAKISTRLTVWDVLHAQATGGERVSDLLERLAAERRRLAREAWESAKSQAGLRLA
jgi:hypothetical protein